MVNEHEIRVRVGYYTQNADSRRPVKFSGEVLLKSTNRHVTGNELRYHTWVLYAVGDGRYRVIDTYTTEFAKEQSHTELSSSLTPTDIMRKYPILGNDAIKHDIWMEEDVIEEA